MGGFRRWDIPGLFDEELQEFWNGIMTEEPKSLPFDEFVKKSVDIATENYHSLLTRLDELNWPKDNIIQCDDPIAAVFLYQGLHQALDYRKTENVEGSEDFHMPQILIAPREEC